MKILFGLHGNTHSEIAQSEIDAFERAGIITATCSYGNWGTAKGFMSSWAVMFKNAFKLKNKVREHNIDIVYLNTALDFKTSIRDSVTIFILKTYKAKIKIVLKFHGSESATIFSKTNLLKKFVFKKASLLLVLSQEERNNFLKAGVPPGKVQVTANVIDKNLYKIDKDFKSSIGIPGQTSLILFVGRFMNQKGILDLIEACRLIKKTHTNSKLICLGDGPLLEEVNRRIKNYNLEENILLLGHIPEGETRNYYANCEILALPTYHEEGFPMAVFQAVGAGRPVITTKIRAAADYLVEYENCLWVEKKNPEELCRRIIELMDNKELQNKMRNNNLLLAEKFTAGNIVNTLLEYFNRI